MSKQVKTILVLILVIPGLFLILRFVGASFVSSLSPDVETSYQKNESKSGRAVVGEGAPYFLLPSSSGNKIDLASLSGSGVVLTFWSTWNHESADQIKIFDDYLASRAAYLKDVHVQIIPVNSQENRNTVENFIRRGGYNVETLMDESGEVSNNYGVQTLPVTFFIDEGGIVTEIFVGTMSQKTLGDKIEGILH